jgi:phospholipid/cholesterol/gamma-HCH transport system substrate-binding protein
VNDQPPSTPPPVRHLEVKATLLLALLVALLVGSALYVLYARGVFEETQRLVLIADDSEGVQVGMDMTFSGFPIGRVRRIELGGDGAARIIIDVPKKDAHWLRESSVFTLAGTLANLQTATDRLKGRHGALGVLFGNDEDASKLIAALDRTNALLARVDGLAARVDSVVGKADEQIFGAEGVMPETRAAIVQLNGALADARNTLRQADRLLAEAQAVAANAKVASADLGTLRAEVEASLRKVERLVDEINRKWPFARDTELELR